MLKRLRQIGISCALKKLKHSLFIDAAARDICARNGAYEYLQRYAYVCNQSHEERKSEPKHNIICTYNRAKYSEYSQKKRFICIYQKKAVPLQ